MAKSYTFDAESWDRYFDEAAKLAEFNQYHDQHGRFTSGDSPAVLGLDEFIRRAQASNADMEAAYADWRGGLSAGEVTAIRGWQRAHAGIADTLRHPELADPRLAAKEHVRIAALDSAISKSALPHDMTLYRGMQGSPGHMVGRVLRDKSFISTTFSEKTARSFAGGNTLLRITAHKGQHAAFLPGVGGHQNSEHEFLLPRNARIRVTGHAPSLADGTQVFNAEYE